MAEEPRAMFQYRTIRYLPNALRDEWVNVGVLLEEARSGRRECRLIEEPREINRVRRIHPDADQDLLRALPREFETLLDGAGAKQNLERLDQIAANGLQLSTQKAVLGDDFDAELDRLFREKVAAPRGRGRGALLQGIESTRDWIKSKINDVFLRRRVPGVERNVRVEEFTEPGDPFKFDYAYRNGVRGYVQALTLGRDPAQAKVLAYTAERIRDWLGACEFTAVTEMAPDPQKPRHEFMARLLADQKIALVPAGQIEKFAEELRLKLQ